eukprot:3500915-Rhodomonas_salina.1
MADLGEVAGGVGAVAVVLERAVLPLVVVQELDVHVHRLVLFPRGGTAATGSSSNNTRFRFGFG